MKQRRIAWAVMVVSNANCCRRNYEKRVRFCGTETFAMIKEYKKNARCLAGFFQFGYFAL
jgi:hypothetical protein